MKKFGFEGGGCTRYWAIVVGLLPGMLGQPAWANAPEDSTHTATADAAAIALSRDANTDLLVDLLGNAIGCRLSEEFQVDLPIAPLYESNAGSCDLINPESAAGGSYFSDAACSMSVEFQPTGQFAYCASALDKSGLGNADDLQGRSPVWTLSPGSRYDLGARPLRAVSQPYMQRNTYREVETESGTCRLEMRVYKSSPNASGLRSMVMLHGGSWTSRGFGFFGLEMTVPHFTSEGYVVFTPFYRLLDDAEGNAACHNASITNVIDDAEFALDWVIENAAQFGGNDFPVVFGQSAGAHLAASLSVHQPEKVSNAVLFYPPTDFTDFALRAMDGSYTDEQGLRILERVVGTTIDQVDISASPVPENSFPQLVEPNPGAFPPMFFLHGLADTLVEPRQSVRLCHALSGNIESGPVPDSFLESEALQQNYVCDDRGSAIHLIKEGQHALDVCISSNILLQSSCLSGSEASRVEVAQAMGEAVAWSSRVADQQLGSLGGGSSGSGGGALLWLWVLAVFRWRRV